MTKQYETDAVMLEIMKEKNKNKSKCRLRPVAGGTATVIDGIKYLIGGKKSKGKKNRSKKAGSAPPRPISAKLWPLNSAGMTETEFSLKKRLARWALSAWESQRKVRLVVACEKNKKNRITKITLL